MYVLHMVLTMNSDYLPKQHKMIDLCNRDGLCSLWGGSGKFVYHLHIFRVRAVTLHVTYLLTPRSGVLLEKLTVPQLVKIFPTLYVTRRFTTAFTRARHLSLSWVSSMHCNSSKLIHLNNLRMWTACNKFGLNVYRGTKAEKGLTIVGAFLCSCVRASWILCSCVRASWILC